MASISRIACFALNSSEKKKRKAKNEFDAYVYTTARWRHITSLKVTAELIKMSRLCTFIKEMNVNQIVSLRKK